MKIKDLAKLLSSPNRLFRFLGHKLPNTIKNFALGFLNVSLKRHRCNICGYKNLSFSYAVWAHYFLRCPKCDIYFASEFPSTKSIIQEFLITDNKEYWLKRSKHVISVGEHEKGWSDWINWKKHTFKRLRLEEFEKEIGDGGRALEIGCAEGKVLEILKKRGWEVVGLEISEYLAKLCQKSDLKVIIGTAEMINFKKEYFNLVLMFHTLEHTTNPVLVLRNIFSMLRKNGRVILEVPCFKNKNELYADFCNLSHFYFFSERGIEKMLSAVGFTYRDKFIYGDELHKPKHNICYLFEKVV